MSQTYARIPQQFIDPETGNLTNEAQKFLDELINGGRDYSVGTLISGQNKIVNGTQNLSRVLVGGEDLVARLDAVEASANDANAAATAGSVQITASASFVNKGASGGGTLTTDAVTLTTDAVTLTIAGGTSPYTVAYTKVSGSTFTVTGDTSRSSAGAFDITFGATIGEGGYELATYKATVTDNAGATASVNVSVSFFDSDQIGGLGS